ncbi:hypothetical protein LIT25_22600 [Bacillus sp. F19]|nr:hypothetical protein LIT25_22600 [Bacillus sp. F19]
MIRKLIILLTAFMLFVPAGTFAGSFGNQDPPGNPGQWYTGDTPPGSSSSKSPIVFIHGLNSSSNTWWNQNDMYSTAYANGYRTAFIDLYPAKNMWDNGALLAQKLSEIYQYFGGQKLMLVSHSKGGIDAQSALVHYGAHQYVSNVITLSTPHSGSQLADLTYSSWAGWLSGILGSKNDAVYSLQTGYMSNFREQTDAHTNSRKNRIYTFGGTKWGSFGSSLYWGGLYLSSYGSNDGAVTVQSSRLSYGTEIRTGSWDHTSIKKGSSTFLLFEPYLRSTAAAESINMISEENNAVRASYYYRGGEFTGTQQESFNVEESVSEITVDWMSSSPSTKLALDSPDGKTDYHSFKTIKADGIFEGAYHHQIVIPKPKKGKWSLTALNSSGEAYFLNVAYLSADNDAISLLPINEQNQNIAFKINQAKLQKEVEAFVIVDHFQTKTKKQTKTFIKSIKKAGIGLELKQEGIYNITVDIRGKTQNGDIFERTIVQTVYVDSSGKIFSQ